MRRLPAPARCERGSTAPLIIGLVGVLALVVALVVDVSAAYLQRSGLATLADGAALRAADLGATGSDVYDGGLAGGSGSVSGTRLQQTPAQARAAVAGYLNAVGAFASYPGLSFEVSVDPAADAVRVSLHAPLELPLRIPGGPRAAGIGATGSAATAVD